MFVAVYEIKTSSHKNQAVVSIKWNIWENAHIGLILYINWRAAFFLFKKKLAYKILYKKVVSFELLSYFTFCWQF